MAIANRAEFGEWCLRKLGKPVIAINVAPSQVEDRVNEAIQTYQGKHFDATEKEWVAYRLTQLDVDNGYITTPEGIQIVDKIMPLTKVYGYFQLDGNFNLAYNHWYGGGGNSWDSMDSLSYYMSALDWGTNEDLLQATERFEFTKHKRKLVIYGKPLSELGVGAVICIHVFRLVDPDTDPSVFNDKWLKQYATAMIKQQWGQNLLKHEGIQLLGGVTVNGQQLYDYATAELQQLDDSLESTYMEPVSFLFG